MKCPNNIKYNNYCLKFSDQFLEKIQNKGYKIKSKIGEGGQSDVFLVEKNKNNYAMTLFNKSFNIKDKLEFAKKYPNLFPIIYDFFYIDIPYSEQSKKYKKHNFNNRSIHIMEKLDYDLKQYINFLGRKNPYFFE